MLTRSRQDPTRFAQQLFDGLPRRYDLLAEALSFGQNRRWRRTMVDSVVEGDPATVLDVATGTAGVALQLARRTGAHVTGIDVTEAMLRRGRASVLHHGLDQRIALVGGQAERLPFPDATFDALTFTYLLRYVADPAATIAELARVVRPGGTIASLEFYVPPRRLLARRLVALHPRGPARPGRAGGPGVVPRRALPRSEHLRPLRPLPPPVDRRRLAACRSRRRRRPCHEPRGRAGDVGAPRR